MKIAEDIRRCRLCVDRFAATETGHAPRPVLRARPGARILIAGQAPGMRVHQSGLPFDDPSGDRLRHWLGMDRETFYDVTRVAIVPMAFCFPGCRRGSDLPPPAICARTWRAPLLGALGPVPLTLLVGGHAQTWHLKTRNVTETVSRWRDFLPGILPLPHPSWRNTAWLKRNPWFEAELMPALRARVAEVMR